MAQASIDALRTELDLLDRELFAVLGRRRELSRQIQQLRVSEGGGRVEPGQEQAVIDRFVAALGEPGAALGRACLVFCRGSGPPATGG